MGKEWQKKLKEYSKKRDELRMKARLECAEMRKELEKKASELQKHQNKETELQNELRMLKEERTRAENGMLRSHTVQIEQLEAKARLECAEMRKELENKHCRDIGPGNRGPCPIPS